jgi:hypothetical protein
MSSELKLISYIGNATLTISSHISDPRLIGLQINHGLTNHQIWLNEEQVSLLAMWLNDATWEIPINEVN